MKIILIIGPQGSGNHIWSKVFTTWADAEFWVGHKDEPHSKLWENMDSWKTHSFSGNTVVSISIPYAVEGQTSFPDIKQWKKIMNERGIDSKICVVTRDQNINFLQNKRVRQENHYDQSVEYIKSLEVDCFLSTETLLIYQNQYIHQLSQQLDYPIDFKDRKFFDTSFNEKYVHYVEDFHLDDTVREVSGMKKKENWPP